MRIGLIAPPWIPVPPPGYGGLETVVANLARGLSLLDHEVHLFTVGASTSPVIRDHLFRDPVEPMGQAVSEAAHVLAAYEALADMDVIHDHTILGPLIAGRAGLRTPPVVTTNHGPFTTLTRRIFREIARSAAVAAISADHATRALNVPIAAVIHHGVDLEAYEPGDGSGGYLVFIGRMSPEKGVDRAVRIAHAASRPLRLVFKMREPAEHAYFRTRVEPLLSPDDELVEEPPFSQQLKILGEAEALLNPITWPEPFGLVMAESLAAGTPVIASPRGAAPEIVTHGRTGYLSATESLAAEAVEELTHIDREACRIDAERRFSLERMARDHERLYRRVMEHEDSVQS